MARPIFVFGAPRSGTGLISAYIGSSPGVLNLREFGGFHWATVWAERLVLADAREAQRARFIEEAVKFSADFASQMALERGCEYYVDSTPSNLLAAPRLLNHTGDPVVVLVLRRPAGVIQSLERSFASGRNWAGSNIQERAEIWRTFNAYALTLSPETTVVVNYDRLCERPLASLSRIDNDLRSKVKNFLPSRRALIDNHNGGVEKRTIAYLGPSGIRLRRISSFDRTRWSNKQEGMVSGMVGDVEDHLRRAFGAYDAEHP